MSSTLPDWITAISTSMQVVIALFAAGVVWHEYGAHKAEQRAGLALALVEKVSSEELMAFAVTSLDWGGGCVLVPPSWRAILENGKPQYSAHVVEEALKESLSRETEEHIIHQLYRHAFVRLFNHLESIAIHVRADPALLNELEPIAWIAHRLRRPNYVQQNRPPKERDLYTNALRSWYSPYVLSFVCQLDERFPELD